MIRLPALFVLLFSTVLFVGCERKSEMPGPTVNKFLGKLVQSGKPVTFPEADKVELKLTHSSGQSFGVPIKSDGTFNVGEMPIGKYSAMLRVTKGTVAEKSKGSGLPSMYGVPGGFEIKDGQTEYTVDLGAGYKPETK